MTNSVMFSYERLTKFTIFLMRDWKICFFSTWPPFKFDDIVSRTIANTKTSSCDRFTNSWFFPWPTNKIRNIFLWPVTKFHFIFPRLIDEFRDDFPQEIYEIRGFLCLIKNIHDILSRLRICDIFLRHIDEFRDFFALLSNAFPNNFLWLIDEFNYIFLWPIDKFCYIFS